MTKPAAALLREWHEEITAELVEAREALPAARQRLREEEAKAASEASRKRELSALIQKGVGPDAAIANALQRRFAESAAELQKALVRPAQHEIETIVFRISDLTSALEQIDRALRIAEPEPSQPEREAPRRPVAEAYDPIVMPGGDAA
jgi:hypothetical protein